ncbi:MAG: hypothetical protein LBH26_01305 [Treponema sp.]|jgi:hypothetical protein|nr:hypothetical protein [Treponema sp.]
MKKMLFAAVFLMAGLSIFAYDGSLSGTSWGMIQDGEKEEIIRFGSGEIIFADMLFYGNMYTEEDDSTILLSRDDEAILIQYFVLSPRKMLLIMSEDTGDIQFSFILTKL